MRRRIRRPEYDELEENPHDTEGWPSICRQALFPYRAYAAFEVADVFGIAKSTLNRWLAGTCVPRKREAREFLERARIGVTRGMNARARTEEYVRARRAEARQASARRASLSTPGPTPQ